MDNLRFVLFVLFAYLSYELWLAWQEDYGPKPPIAVVAGQSPTGATAKPNPLGTQTQAVTNASAVAGDALKEGQRITVATDVMKVEIDAAAERERLQKEIAKKLGYKLVDHRLELYAVPLDGNSGKNHS